MFYFIFTLFTAFMTLAIRSGSLFPILLVLVGFLIMLPLTEELEDENI
jgi:hypothetical protein